MKYIDKLIEDTPFKEYSGASLFFCVLEN